MVTPSLTSWSCSTRRPRPEPAACRWRRELVADGQAVSEHVVPQVSEVVPQLLRRCLQSRVSPCPPRSSDSRLGTLCGPLKSKLPLASANRSFEPGSHHLRLPTHRAEAPSNDSHVTSQAVCSSDPTTAKPRSTEPVGNPPACGNPGSGLCIVAWPSCARPPPGRMAHPPGQTASRNVARRLGMRLDGCCARSFLPGVRHDTEVWSLLAPEWGRPRNHRPLAPAAGRADRRLGAGGGCGGRRERAGINA